MTIEKGETWPVLDRGYVKFIDSMGTDESIIEAARMSTGRGFEGWDKDAALLEFLYKNRHMTPFEMVEIQIEVYAPIMVFREWRRHRTQSFNEFSARYSAMPNEHYVPALNRFKKQSSTNKQASGDDAFTEEQAGRLQGKLAAEQNAVYATYDDMLDKGLAKEVARLNTPVSRYSKMRAKTDLRNWLAFCALRMEENAQWEIRQYANVVGEIIQAIAPRTWALFVEHDFFAVRFSRKEMEVLKMLVYDFRVNATILDKVRETRALTDKEAQALVDKISQSKPARYVDVPALKVKP